MVRCEYMFQSSAYDRPQQARRPCSAGMRLRAETAVLLLSAAGALVCGAGDLVSRQNEDFPATKPSHLVTNVAQFRTLSGLDYIAGCDFHLTGVVTLVDMDRHLVVLQDASGAVALNSRVEGQVFEPGNLPLWKAPTAAPILRIFRIIPIALLVGRYGVHSRLRRIGVSIT